MLGEIQLSGPSGSVSPLMEVTTAWWPKGVMTRMFQQRAVSSHCCKWMQAWSATLFRFTVKSYVYRNYTFKTVNTWPSSQYLVRAFKAGPALNMWTLFSLLLCKGARALSSFTGIRSQQPFANPSTDGLWAFHGLVCLYAWQCCFAGQETLSPVAGLYGGDGLHVMMSGTCCLFHGVVFFVTTQVTRASVTSLAGLFMRGRIYSCAM